MKPTITPYALTDKFRTVLFEPMRTAAIVIEALKLDSWVDTVIFKKRGFRIDISPASDNTTESDQLRVQLLALHKHLENALASYSIPRSHNATMTSNLITGILTYSTQWQLAVHEEMYLNPNIDDYTHTLEMELKTLEALGCINELTFYPRERGENGETIERPYFELTLTEEQTACLRRVIEEARHARLTDGKNAENVIQVNFDGDQKLMPFISDRTISQRQ